jgi:hypothetical protein
VVLLLTANPSYALGGISPGVSLTAVAPRLHIGGGFKIGRNTWYLIPNGSSRGVLRVRGGIIQEIGIANRRLTLGRAATHRFFEAFR